MSNNPRTRRHSDFVTDLTLQAAGDGQEQKAKQRDSTIDKLSSEIVHLTIPKAQEYRPRRHSESLHECDLDPAECMALHLSGHGHSHGPGLRHSHSHGQALTGQHALSLDPETVQAVRMANEAQTNHSEPASENHTVANENQKSPGSKDEETVQRLAKRLLTDLAHHNFHKLGAFQGLIGAYSSKKNEADHAPHNLFVELNELLLNIDVEMEWEETARWIKYEEDLESGSNKWGKPHVASLTFSSVLQLKRCIDSCIAMFDLWQTDLEVIAETIVNAMETNQDEAKVLLWKALCKCKKTQATQQQPWGADEAATFLNNLHKPQKQEHDEGADLKDVVFQKMVLQETSVDKKADIEQGKPELRKRRISSYKGKGGLRRMAHDITTADPAKKKKLLVTRLPPETEVAMILVGSVSVLQAPTIVFVRLAKSVTIPKLTDNPLPVRFLFILMGPPTLGINYHEVGRCLGTLFSTKNFRQIAYKALDREDILNGINEFLEDSIVIPPGRWDMKAMMPYDNIQEKSRKLDQKRNRSSGEPDLLDAVDQEEESHEHGAHDELKRTGKLFGGMVNDLKRRYPYYLTDICDGLNLKCLFATLMVFLAQFVPALTFGAILNKKTSGYFGVKETLLSTCIGGILFGLFSANPMVLLGVTGPILVFEQSLYKFCKAAGFKLLPTRIWTAFFTWVFSMITVCFEGSFLIKYLTRFSDEVLSALVSVIFISESMGFLSDMFDMYPILSVDEYCSLNSDGYPDDTYSNYTTTESTADSHHKRSVRASSSSSSIVPKPNTALIAVVLLFGTFTIAYALFRLKQSKFLPRQIRTLLGNIGLTLAIVIMILLSATMFGGSNYSDTLKLTLGMVPTKDERGWIFTPLPMSSWLSLVASLIAGFLFFLIIFLETEAAQMILAERKPSLKKGCGYHWDLVVTGLLNILCAFIGLPWLCSTLLQSGQHFNANTVTKQRAPGQKPANVKVMEQRITPIGINLMVGLCLLLAPVINSIPVAILFGAFFYFGITSLHGRQMIARTILLFVPAKYHPSVLYCLRVKTWRMHMFTLIQLLCFLLVWGVKKIKMISVAFPFAVMVAMLIREFILPRVFSKAELEALDGENEEEED